MEAQSDGLGKRMLVPVNAHLVISFTMKYARVKSVEVPRVWVRALSIPNVCSTTCRPIDNNDCSGPLLNSSDTIQQTIGVQCRYV